jgi:hypothetical protein
MTARSSDGGMTSTDDGMKKTGDGFLVRQPSRATVVVRGRSPYACPMGTPLP